MAAAAAQQRGVGEAAWARFVLQMPPQPGADGTIQGRILTFLKKPRNNRAAGWTAGELADRVGCTASDVSKVYSRASGKLLRWGGKEGASCAEAAEAEELAAKEAKVRSRGPPSVGGQPFYYKFSLASEGLGKPGQGKNRENLCPHKAAPHHARGMCHRCYSDWKKDHKHELLPHHAGPGGRSGGPKRSGDSPAMAEAPPKKRRRGVMKAAMDSIACTACRKRDDEDSMVLCDGCDDAWHTFCMTPKRDEVPSGDWFCHLCLAAAAGRRAELAELAAHAASRHSGKRKRRPKKAAAPWRSALVGRKVYLCLPEGWHCGRVAACVCNDGADSRLGLSSSRLTLDGASGARTPTGDVEYDVKLDGNKHATTPTQPRTLRVSWLWLRQGRQNITKDEAERLVGTNVRKRFAGHGVFKGVVESVKVAVVQPPTPGDDGGAAASVPASPTASDGGEIWFNIRYEDGDREDVAFHELTAMMMDARQEDAKEEGTGSGSRSGSADAVVGAAAGVSEMDSGKESSGESAEGSSDDSAGEKGEDDQQRSTIAVSLPRPVFPGMDSWLGKAELQGEEENIQLHHLQSLGRHLKQRAADHLLCVDESVWDTSLDQCALW